MPNENTSVFSLYDFPLTNHWQRHISGPDLRLFERHNCPNLTASTEAVYNIIIHGTIVQPHVQKVCPQVCVHTAHETVLSTVRYGTARLKLPCEPCRAVPARL